VATYDLPVAVTMMVGATAGQRPRHMAAMLSVVTRVACEATADGPAATNSGLGRFLRESRSVFRLTPSMVCARPVEGGNHAPEAGPGNSRGSHEGRRWFLSWKAL
jgi:hypothetical protein